MSEYFKRCSRFVIEDRKISLEIIENPERVLGEKDKDLFIEVGRSILEVTTGHSSYQPSDVKKFLFGVKDRGRVLCVFKEKENYIGFTAFHFVNRDGKFVRYAGGTILHAGSGHILPTYQGGALWLKAARIYISALPEEIHPPFVEGLTQSPRFLRLMTLKMQGRIYPNMNISDIDNLRDCQKELLPIIAEGFGQRFQARSECVVNLGEQVYAERVSAGEDYDNFFYRQLGVKPENGDFVHFVAMFPDNFFAYKL